MFTQNAINLLATMFRAPTTANGVFGAVPLGGGGSTVFTMTGATSNARFNVNENGGGFKLGKGTTPPTRFDNDVETPLDSSPEKDQTVMNHPSGFVAGISKSNSGGMISPTTDAGDITEAIKVMQLKSASVPHPTLNICIWRDTFSPVPFTAGEQINIEMEVLS